MSKHLPQPKTAERPTKQPRLGSEYKTRKRDQKRDEILDAAAAVFSEKGFHNATLKDIADRVNLLPASLYHYVESKEDALLAVCRRSARAFLDTVRLQAGRHAPARELLSEIIVQHMLNNRRELVYSFAFRRRDLPPPLLPKLAEMSRDYLAYWEELIARGIEAGEFAAATNPKLAALALLAMCNGAIEWYENRSEAEIRGAAAQFAALALDGLRVRALVDGDRR